MSADELMAFWKKHHGPQGRSARDLFPEGGKGTRQAANDLALYASNKATAMQCRVHGEIETALMYEVIADRIYQRLPAWARW